MSSRPIIFAVGSCVAVAIFIGVLEWQRRAPGVSAAPSTVGTRPSLTGVADAVRSLKLVTWQFDSTLSAASISDRWYGDAIASVQAPVHYQYGLDLSELQRTDLLLSPDEQTIVFIVPPPERIAAEVDLDRLEQNLRVSGMRWRSQNQVQLDAARAKLAKLARETTLSPADDQRLRDVSREQLEQLLAKAIDGQGYTRVAVRFAR